jgi:hypothetical protein
VARDILNQPHLWPGDIVGLASRRIGAKRSGALLSIAEVEGRDHWFCDD